VVCEQRQGLLHREQDALHVAIERVVIMLLRDLAERQQRATAGIDEEHVDSAFLSFTRSNSVPSSARFEESIRCRSRRQWRRRPHRVRLATTGDEDVGAFAGKATSGGKADPAAAPGHDCDLAFSLRDM
jgi:hypothetical protein